MIPLGIHVSKALFQLLGNRPQAERNAATQLSQVLMGAIPWVLLLMQNVSNQLLLVELVQVLLAEALGKTMLNQKMWDRGIKKFRKHSLLELSCLDKKREEPD